MLIVPLADAKARLSQFVEKSREGPIIVTRNGRPVAMLIAITEDDDLEGMVMTHSPKLRRLLDAADARVRAGQKLSHDEFWTEVEHENASEGQGAGQAEASEHGGAGSS